VACIDMSHGSVRSSRIDDCLVPILRLADRRDRQGFCGLGFAAPVRLFQLLQAAGNAYTHRAESAFLWVGESRPQKRVCFGRPRMHCGQRWAPTSAARDRLAPCGEKKPET